MSRSLLLSTLGPLAAALLLVACADTTTTTIPGSAADDPGESPGEAPSSTSSSSGGASSSASSSSSSGGGSTSGGSTSGGSSGGGSTSGGSTSGGSSGADPSIDNGADDPTLVSATRPSAPYECQGTPITAADVPGYVAQGRSGVRADSRNHRQWSSEVGLGLLRAERTCTAATGCGPWHHEFIVDFPEYHKDLVRIALEVAPNGDVYVENPRWYSHANYGPTTELRKLAPTLDTQLLVRMFNASLDANADVRRRLRIRATRPNPGDPICVSAASSVEKSTNANGVTTEWFWVGSVSLPVAARPAVEPLDESPYECAGNPSTDAEIAQMFAPGQVAVRFQGASASNYLERSCHPITGCTAYTKSYRSTRLVQVEVKGAGFQVRLDNVASGPTYPLTNGVFTVAAGDTGAVRGGCIDERAAKVQAVGRYGATSETLQLERRER